MLVFFTLELAAVLTIIVGLYAGMPWITFACCGLIIIEAASVVRRRRTSGWSVYLIAAASVLAVASVPIFRRGVHLIEYPHVLMAFLVVTALAAMAWASEDYGSRRLSGMLALGWSFLGAAALLCVAYNANQAISFHIGLAACVVFLVLLRMWFARRSWAIQSTNTLLLLAVSLPFVDWVTRPKFGPHTQPDTRARYYSYEAARRDPVAFAWWWNYFVGQWNTIWQTLHIESSSGAPPFRLRAGVSAQFFQSAVVVNSKGFRGPEIRDPKGSAYRIVAIGESTTFGCTLNPEDRPWTEWLEEMIATRVATSRPVEVINAGVAAYTLGDSLARIHGDILPLEPDMIISYHGINGFSWLDASIPPSTGARPPRYRERPIRFLANLEHRIRLQRHSSRLAQAAPRRNIAVADPFDTLYGQKYEELVHIARTNHIRLALANFSMAVNSRSPRDVIEFYRGGFPRVYEQIDANVVHSGLLDRFVERHPEVILVNTQAGLDGQHPHYIDLVHFTESGREQLAKNIFAGIRATLERDLNIKQPDTVTRTVRDAPDVIGQEMAAVALHFSDNPSAALEAPLENGGSNPRLLNPRAGAIRLASRFWRRVGRPVRPKSTFSAKTGKRSW
jgi:lysophospholipase L1-like esterase